MGDGRGEAVPPREWRGGGRVPPALAALLLLMAGRASAYTSSSLTGAYRPLRGSDPSFRGAGLTGGGRGRRGRGGRDRRRVDGLSMQFGGGGMMKKQSGGTPSFGTGGESRTPSPVLFPFLSTARCRCSPTVSLSPFPPPSPRARLDG